MQSKERILIALECGEPDRVPIMEAGIDNAVLIELARLLEIDTKKLEGFRSHTNTEILDLYSLVVDKLGLDATCLSFSTGLSPINDEYAQDKYGVVFRLSPHGQAIVVEGPIKEISDLKNFDMAAKLTLDDFASIRYVIQRVGPEKAHFVGVTDPFKISWLLRGGMEHLLMDYLLNPELVHALMRVATDWAMAAVDMALDAGADVIFTDGDLAGGQTTLMSPEHYREYVKPYQKEIADHAHRQGLLIVKHTDGNVWPILNDFVEIGYDGLHPVQPQCMDIVKVKERLKGKICLLGNIDCQNLLFFGTEEEVKNAVRETIIRVAPGGGYILTSSNSIYPGCRAKNYIAMVRAAHEYGALK